MANSSRVTGKQLLDLCKRATTDAHIYTASHVLHQKLNQVCSKPWALVLTCRVQRLDTLLHVVKGHLPQHSDADDPPSSTMHAVCGHGGLGHVTILVEDAPLIALADQLGSAGAALGGIEGLQRVVELGIVKVTGETAGGPRIGMGCTPGAGSPPHVICTAVGQT